MIALVISSDALVWRAAPAASDANFSEPEENSPVKATQSWRVLVVEDEFFISLHMKELLETLGHEVIAIAVSADEAVNIAATELPDVVLMDIRLVGPRDGIDAAEEIRRRFGIGSIFVTANTDNETRKRALAIKPIAFLEKPLTEHRLRLGLSGLSSD
jgi:CheY-like chemotaxis protein